MATPAETIRKFLIIFDLPYSTLALYSVALRWRSMHLSKFYALNTESASKLAKEGKEASFTLPSRWRASLMAYSISTPSLFTIS